MTTEPSDSPSPDQPPEPLASDGPSYEGIAKYLPLLWFGLLIFSFFWVLVVYRSWTLPFFFALLIFIIARPFHLRLNQKWPKLESINSVIMTLGCLFLIVMPFSILFVLLIQEAFELANSLVAYFTPEKVFELTLSVPYITEYITTDDFWYVNLAERYQQLLGEYAGYLEFGNLSNVVDTASDFLVGSIAVPVSILKNFLFMMIILVFLFKDGKRFGKFFYAALPFPDWMEKRVARKFSQDVTAVLKGNFLVAIFQGFFVGIAFAVSGIGSPLLWGAVGSMVSIIPIIGTGIVFIPGTLYLIFLESELGWGIFLFTFCMTTYQGLDLLLKPKLLDEKLGLHPLVLFLAILGGLTEFGILGVIIGPLIVTVFMTIWEIAKHADDEMFMEGNG